MFKRVFVTHVVPKQLIEKLHVSMAANYFSYNLIDENCFDEIFSLVPTNINDKVIAENSSVTYLQSRFIANSGIFKVLNILLDNVKLFKKISKNSNVWFYNLTHQTIFVFLLLKFFKINTKVFVILLDFTPPTNKFSLQSFIFNQINKSNGIISLTNNNKLLNNNTIVLPGLAPEEKDLKIQNTINNTFLLSGILSKNRCPELILNVFSKFSEYELMITGRIEDEILVEKYINKFKNIKYLGLLGYDDYLKVLEKVTFSINSRDPTYEENNFNFPSKTIEHLLHNKVIISTMEYSELEGIHYFYVKPTVDDFMLFFNGLKSIDKSLLIEKYVNQSQKVSELFGVSRWIKSFKELENNF
jgi:hypothetical protein